MERSEEMTNKARVLIEKLKTPERKFSPMPFWFLNDDLRDEEIIRQMTDFNKKGVHGVVLHPRIGIPDSIEYLSDKFMHFIITAVETAAKLDMKIILYDEAMYPSGSAHGLVVKSDPRFASQGIILSEDKAEGKVIAETKSGKYIVQVNTNGTIRGIHFGEDDHENNAPPSADLLSHAAVNTFIELTHERYYSVLKRFFGNTIIGFFTDEPSAVGRCARENCFPWTWGFEDVIESLGGKLSDLEALFTGENNDTVHIYGKAVLERENEVFYKSLSAWCENHGIALMGHPHRGDDIECERFFHIPGQDLVLRWIAPEEGGLAGGAESAQAKCSSDAARIYGGRNSNECYGACCKDTIPWNFSGGDLKWYTDWLGVRGVNLYIPHAFYYSVAGERKDERPPDVGPNNIWWQHFNTISLYIKRISCLMSDSKNAAKICVMCEKRDMPTDEVVPLYENQVEFNYVPYSAIKESNIKNNKLYIGENVYEYVLCDKKNRLSALKQVKGLREIPYRDIYLDKACPDLRCSHIIKDGVDAFFLTNEGEKDIDVHAAVPLRGALIAMDFWTGDVKDLSCEEKEGTTSFHLLLKRRESILIVVDSENQAKWVPEHEKNYIDVQFKMISENCKEFSKTYSGTVNCTETDNMYIKVTGEEMAECFVNEKFAGFSLWNAHEFYLTPYLKKGENIIEIKMTGSAVNRFTEHRMDYGIVY
ncbi:MAG: hypothetical protein E7408_04680 [Ruminococcaceae bacterium]|nr:hypothetical protein [Oscillospiraceae bacterium]